MNKLIVASPYRESDCLSVEIVLNVGTLMSETWYKVETDSLAVSKDFFSPVWGRITEFLRTKGVDNSLISHATRISFQNDIGQSLDPKESRITKRISAWVKKHYACNLPAEILTWIGNQSDLYRDSTYLFCLSRDLMFPAHDSYYADEDACFHGGNAHYKGYLDQYGAYALLWRKPNPHYALGKPFARAWALNFEGRLPIFNSYSYGSFGRSAMARTIAHALDGQYYSADIDTAGSYRYASIYFNDEDCWIVDSPHAGRIETVSIVITEDMYDDAHMIDYSIERLVCDSCGEGLSEEEAMFSENGYGPYCEDCYSERYATCENCSRECHRDDIVICHGHDAKRGAYKLELCWRCRDKDYLECANCGEYYHADECVVTDNDHAYCENCQDQIDSCCCCGKVHEITDMTEDQHGDRVCEDCVQSSYCTCAHCADIMPNNDYRAAIYAYSVSKREYVIMFLCEACEDEYSRMNPGARHNYVNPHTLHANRTRMTSYHYGRISRRIEKARNARHVKRINAQLRAMERLIAQ